MPTNNYERDFNIQGPLKRPGRLDFRLLNNEDDAGDGFPGLQKQIRNLIHQFHNRFVLDGCTYNGSDTLASGNIIWDNEIVTVAEQTITVNNSEFLYIDSTGTAQTTAVEATAEAGVMIYYRDSGGTGEDIIFKYYQNNLEVYKLAVHKELDMNGDFIVNLGYPTLDEHAASKKYVDDFVVSWAIMVDTTDSIQDAIDTIESLGGGYIYLEEGTHNDATDTFPLTIDDPSVSITIFGNGETTVIDPNSNDRVFEIMECEKVILKDFKINIWDYATSSKKAILAASGGDGPITVDNVHITGDGTNGIGVYASSNYVTVKNCKIHGCDYGVFFNGSTAGIAKDNEIFDIVTSPVYASSCTLIFVQDNLIYNTSAGVGVGIASTDRFFVTNNYIVSCDTTGIYIFIVNDGVVSGNIVFDCDSNDGTPRGGIDLSGNCNYVNVMNNVIRNCNNTGAGDTYAIFVQTGSNDCNIAGNICNGNDLDRVLDQGTNTGFDVNGVYMRNTAGFYGISTFPIRFYNDIEMNSANIDMGAGNIDDVNSIDGGGNAVRFDDNIRMNSADIDMTGNDIIMGSGIIGSVSQINGSGIAVEFADNIDMSGNEIQDLDVLNDNIHYVTSESELQAAIDGISTGFGEIVITESFSVSTTIDVDGGGDYIIRGVSRGTTMTMDSGIRFLDITSAGSCAVRDLKIDASGGSNIVLIRIAEASNNPIIIENLHFIGDATNGYAFNLESDYNIIKNCIIEDLAYGIQISSGSIENEFINCKIDNTYQFAVFCLSDNNLISGNRISGCGNGILADGNSNIISNNRIIDCDNNSGTECYGIAVKGDANIVEGNRVSDIVSSGATAAGIRFYETAIANRNICNGNVVHDVSSTSVAFGIWLDPETEDTLVNNNVVYNLTDSNGSSNIGIYINNADECSVIGNIVRNCTNAGAGTGYGCQVGSGADNTTVVANSFLSNDTNFQNDSGSTTTSGNNTA